MATTATQSRKIKERLLPLGTRVSFSYGVGAREGIIVEYRGPLASGGRQLYGIESPDEYNAVYIELAADQIKILK